MTELSPLTATLSQPAAAPPPLAGGMRGGLRNGVARFRRSHHSRILSGSLIMLLSSAVVAGVNFAYNVYVAQRLGPPEFGHVATSVSLLLIASALTLSFQIVCAKFIARSPDAAARGAVYRRLRLRAWQVGGALGVLLLALSLPLSSFLRFPTPWIIVLMAIGITFYVPLGVKRGIFQGTCAFPRLAANYSLEAVAKFLLALVLVTRYGAPGAVIAVMLSVIAAYFWPRPQALFNTPGTLAEPLLPGEGRQAIVFFVGQVIIMNTDLIMVKHFFPAAEAGQYAAVALVGRVLFYASWSVIAAMFPVTAGSSRSERPNPSLVAIPMALVLAMFLGFLGVLQIFPAAVMKTIFGPGFQQAESLLGLYAANTAVYALAVVLMAYEMSRKIANTGWLQMVFSGLVVVGISLFHDSLRQVITVLLVLMVGLLLAVALPFFRSTRRVSASTLPDLQEAA
jgi:O-antigen/teichoic acid export membrane protein